MTILERMAASLEALDRTFDGRRKAKAFYLNALDFDRFEATNPPIETFPFGNNPPEQRDEPAFRGLPVRLSRAAVSRLYDWTTTGRPIPVDETDPVVSTKGLSDIPADEIEAALDAISRTRALTEIESIALEAAMKGRVVLSKRDAARLGIKRKASPA